MADDDNSGFDLNKLLGNVFDPEVIRELFPTSTSFDQDKSTSPTPGGDEADLLQESVSDLEDAADGFLRETEFVNLTEEQKSQRAKDQVFLQQVEEDEPPQLERTSIADIPADQVQTGEDAPLDMSIPINVKNQTAFFNQLKIHEGFRKRTYLDTKGIPTIGVGFNLNKQGAKERIEALGYDYEAILRGEQDITEADALRLLKDDVKIAVKDARDLVSNFDELDPVRKRAVVDLSFNMGRRVLSQFKSQTIPAIEDFNFDLAADFLSKSLWAEQVGNRAKNVISMLKTGQDLDIFNGGSE